MKAVANRSCWATAVLAGILLVVLPAPAHSQPPAVKSCGTFGQPCCSGLLGPFGTQGCPGAENTVGLVCSAGYCAACGNNGQQCCRRANQKQWCNPGHACDSQDVCAACGTFGQPCCSDFMNMGPKGTQGCPGTENTVGLVCLSTYCNVCGNEGQQCCRRANGEQQWCNPGLACNDKDVCAATAGRRLAAF